jgi:hypothetical protein
MSNPFADPSGSPDNPVEYPEIVPGMPAGDADGGANTESVEQPGKVLRIGSMIKQLLDEVRAAPLDEASRDRLASIFETSIKELSESLSPDLQEELARLSPAFEHDPPSEAELRIAQAQLVGWLEGLFHGIQATLFAQQMQARAQLEEMRRRLPPGSVPGSPDEAGPMGDRPGTYL